MTGPTPIPTTYAGIRFRSRLEARWAVFFDALGLQWEYEPEGYELSDGTLYLPDFYLSTIAGGLFAEVKPQNGDFTKAIRFAFQSRRPLIALDGWPGDIGLYNRCFHTAYSPETQEPIDACNGLIESRRHRIAIDAARRYCFWDPKPSRRAYA